MRKSKGSSATKKGAKRVKKRDFALLADISDQSRTANAQRDYLLDLLRALFGYEKCRALRIPERLFVVDDDEGGLIMALISETDPTDVLIRERLPRHCFASEVWTERCGDLFVNKCMDYMGLSIA